MIFLLSSVISGVELLYVYYAIIIVIIKNLINNKKRKNPECVIGIGLLLFSLSACLFNMSK